MIFLPVKKGTVLIPSGKSNHLSIICCDPVYYPRTLTDSVLIVNISTVTSMPHVDDACILHKGDHPFINHDSFVFYSRADIFSVNSLKNNVDNGNFTPHKPCCDQVFTRVLNGFNVSKHTPYKVKQFYNNYCK